MVVRTGIRVSTAGQFRNTFLVLNDRVIKDSANVLLQGLGDEFEENESIKDVGNFVPNQSVIRNNGWLKKCIPSYKRYTEHARQ